MRPTKLVRVERGTRDVKKEDLSRSSALGSVPAVERAIAILHEVARNNEAVSLAALTAALKLPKSSVLGICNTLAAGGLLNRTESRAYQLGFGLVDLARTQLDKSNPTAHFVDAWNALDVMPEETVVLSVLDGTDAVYVACRNGARGLTFNYRIGMRLPATCTASGKAILSTLAMRDVKVFFRGPLPHLTQQSIATMRELERDLELTRRRGYSIDREEARDGMCCVGAPVFATAGGTAVAAVAVSMMSGEFKTQRREAMVDTVLTLARELSLRLGGHRKNVPVLNAGAKPDRD